MIKVNNIKELREELTRGINRAAQASLEALTEHVRASVVEDYTKRVQQLFYPLRNPTTKAVLDSMAPKDIARKINKIISDDKGTVYIEPKTEADKSGRMQELYGGKPWQKIRTDMQNLDYVNKVLGLMGLKGIKAMSR